jgi:hypothetical protein
LTRLSWSGSRGCFWLWLWLDGLDCRHTNRKWFAGLLNRFLTLALAAAWTTSLTLALRPDQSPMGSAGRGMTWTEITLPTLAAAAAAASIAAASGTHIPRHLDTDQAAFDLVDTNHG